MQENWQKYLAEAIATFIFIFISAGAALANWQTAGALGTTGLALASGLAFAMMIYAIHPISGAHLNPAVTIAMWATGHIKTLMAFGYIISQLVGSVIAALFIKVVFAGMSPQYFLGDPALGPGITPGMGILVEALLAFCLVWTIFATLVDRKGDHQFGGLMAGFALAVCIMVGNYFTMAALNPARSFGMALLSSHWTTHYVYWIGPVIGALAAGFIYHFVFTKKHAG